MMLQQLHELNAAVEPKNFPSFSTRKCLLFMKVLIMLLNLILDLDLCTDQSFDKFAIITPELIIKLVAASPNK